MSAVLRFLLLGTGPAIGSMMSMDVNQIQGRCPARQKGITGTELRVGSPSANMSSTYYGRQI